MELLVHTQYYQKYKVLSKPQCEKIIKEIKLFEEEHYHDLNLKYHVAYLADKKPGRNSHAYALNCALAPVDLPGLEMTELRAFPGMLRATLEVAPLMRFNFASRFLLNCQEYYSDNAAVPKHFDGELLDFKVKGDSLKINKAIRPHQVAVLVLCNDVGKTGTRLHFPDGTSTVVSCKAGEMIIFDNVNCFHSVDAFGAKSKRKDKLVRMTIGWRSLNSHCTYFDGKESKDISIDQANGLTKFWYEKEWPKKWKQIQKNLHKAAF